MKKIITILIIAVMVSLLAVSIFAAGETFISADDYDDSAYGNFFWEVTGNLEDTAGYYDELGKLTFPGACFCVKETAYVWYEFNVPNDGTYTFACEYVARTGKDRAINYVIDPKDPADKNEQTLVNLVPSGEDGADHWYFIVKADLKAGKHTFYICCATGFDDDTLKSCDFYGIKGYLTDLADEIVNETTVEAPAPETEAPAAPVETATPVTETAAPIAAVDPTPIAAAAPVAATPAPQTGDAVFISAVVLLAAVGCALSVVKKR